MAAGHNAKGPAKAATFPDHGSTYPNKDQDMNVATHTTPAGEAATNPFRFETEYPAEATKIRDMECGELIILVDGFIAAMGSYLSIMNMPRCEADSASHRWLDYEMERLGAIREMAMEEMQRRPFDGGYVDEERIRCIVAYLVECGEPVGNLLDLTAQMVTARDEAKRRRRHVNEIGKLIVNAILDDGLAEREQIAASIRERLAPNEVNDADLQAAADYLRTVFDEADARAAA